MDYICKTVGLIPGISAGDIVSDEDEQIAKLVAQYPGEFEVDGEGVAVIDRSHHGNGDEPAGPEGA